MSRSILLHVLTVLTLLVSACDICPDANYQITNQGRTLECYDYDSKYRSDSGECSVVSCIWDCAHLNGGSCNYIDLTFVSCGEGWSLEHKFTADCI